MLTAYFRSPISLERYRSGIAGPYLDKFVSGLGGQGYHRVSIRRHVREVVHFADWAASEGLTIGEPESSITGNDSAATLAPFAPGRQPFVNPRPRKSECADHVLRGVAGFNPLDGANADLFKRCM